MLDFKNISKKGAKIITYALLAALVFTTLIPTFAVSAALDSSAESLDFQNSYYSSDYKTLEGTDPVFESLTWEEAVYLFQQEGNYLILLGGSWCGNTTAVIDYINDAAKAAGVDTIYNLDFRLDGVDGETHVRETNTSSKKGAAYNYLYGELVTRYLTNLNDWVEYTVDSESALTYTNSEGVDVTVPKAQVPFLFIYNKDNTVNNAGESVEGETYPIVYGFEKMLYRDSNGGKDLYSSHSTQDDTTKVTDYTEQVNEAVFNHIGSGEGQLALSEFTKADYIRTSYNEKAGTELFAADEQINIEPITYKQLNWLLEQDGNYLILLGSSWCGNTKAVIEIINDYAVANDVTVYNFDTKLDGGYAKAYWGYEGDLHIRDSKNIFASLYVDLVNTYFDNIETEYTIDSGNYISYEATAEDGTVTEVIANKLQVPYLLAYNKNIVDNDGHDTPILAYVEKMYSLSEDREDYIGIDANYAEYTQAAFAVISAYAEQVGITAVDIAEPVAPAEEDTEAVAAVNEVVETEESETEASQTEETSADAEEETPADTASSGNTGKIIAAVVGIVVVIAIVVFVSLGKKGKTEEK